MTNREIALCNPVCIAIGTYGGSLKDTPAPELGAAVICEVLKREGLSADKVHISGGQGIALALEML